VIGYSAVETKSPFASAPRSGWSPKHGHCGPPGSVASIEYTVYGPNGSLPALAATSVADVVPKSPVTGSTSISRTVSYQWPVSGSK
jgi:hypothetical protein